MAGRGDSSSVILRRARIGRIGVMVIAYLTKRTNVVSETLKDSPQPQQSCIIMAQKSNNFSDNIIILS